MALSRLSRRKVASHLADELIAGNHVVDKLASYLLETKQVRELSLYIRDIESALSERGILIADVSSSYQLEKETEEKLTDYLKKESKAKEVHLRQHLDSNVLGGIRIETPDERLDSTLRHRINQLTTSKI